MGIDRALIERDADPLFAAPDRVPRTDELIGRYHQSEIMRDANGIGDFNARAIRRDISYRAVDAAAVVKRKRAAFEHSMPGYSSLLDHRRGSKYQSVSVENSKAELLAIESNVRCIWTGIQASFTIVHPLHAPSSAAMVVRIA